MSTPDISPFNTTKAGKDLAGGEKYEKLPGSMPPITKEDIVQIHKGDRDGAGKWKIINVLDAGFAYDVQKRMEQIPTITGELSPSQRLGSSRVVFYDLMQSIPDTVGQAISQEQNSQSFMYGHVREQLQKRYGDIFTLDDKKLKQLIAERFGEGVELAFIPFIKNLFELCDRKLRESGEFLVVYRPTYSLEQLAFTLDHSKALLLELTSMDTTYMESFDQLYLHDKYAAEKKYDAAGKFLGLEITLLPQARKEAEEEDRKRREQQVPDKLRRLPSQEPAGCFANSGAGPLVSYLIGRTISSLRDIDTARQKLS